MRHHHHIRRSLALAFRKALKAHTASRRALVAQRLHTIVRPAVPWRILSSSRVRFDGISICERHSAGLRLRAAVRVVGFGTYHREFHGSRTWAAVRSAGSAKAGRNVPL